MSILTAADVRRAAFGNSAQTTTADEDADITEIIAAIDGEVGRRCGPGAVPGTVATWTGQCRSGAIVLPWRYQYISAVVVDGATISASLYDDETRAAVGILDGVNGVAPWSSGTKVVVTAVVGPVTLDPRIQRAAMVMARHWWQLARQNGRGAFANENQPVVDSAMPAEALALLPPNLAGVG